MSLDSRSPDLARPSAGERHGMVFLHQARKVRDLDPAQVDRIARRLRTRSVRTRRTIPWPALAVVGLIMGAGATVSLAMGGLRALPLVGALLAPQSRSDGKTGIGPSHKVPTRSATEPKPSGPPMVPTPPPNVVIPAAPTVPVAPPTPSERMRPDESASPPGKGGIAKPAGATSEARRESARAFAWVTPKPAGGGKVGVASASPQPSTLPTPLTEDPLVTESRSFASVIVLWHRNRNAASALALLDEHDQRYPLGHMRAEAHILRAELYLFQGRKAETLSILDGMSLFGLPRARELQTVRGELRVQAARCTEARADLDLVLAKDRTDSLAQRATRALSHCP